MLNKIPKSLDISTLSIKAYKQLHDQKVEKIYGIVGVCGYIVISDDIKNLTSTKKLKNLIKSKKSDLTRPKGSNLANFKKSDLVKAKNLDFAKAYSSKANFLIFKVKQIFTNP